jgi:hypothetical protein
LELEIFQLGVFIFDSGRQEGDDVRWEAPSFILEDFIHWWLTFGSIFVHLLIDNMIIPLIER